MSYSIWSEEWAVWGAVIAVAFPVLIIVFGELIQRFSARENPMARPLRGVLYLV